jgi:hypothetical protein
LALAHHLEASLKEFFRAVRRNEPGHWEMAAVRGAFVALQQHLTSGSAAAGTAQQTNAE